VGNLASLYHSQGRYSEAEPLHLRVIEARDRTLGPEHPDTLVSVGNLAALYDSQGRYSEAEPLYLRALEVGERTLGPEHPDTLVSVNNLGMLYDDQGRYREAEPLFLRALKACSRTLGSEHPQTLTSVNNLARLYDTQGRYDEALALARRLADGHENHLGANFTGSEQARQAFFDTFAGSTDFILSLHLDRTAGGDDARDLAFETWLRRKGRVLDVQADTLAALRRSLDEEGLALLDTLGQLHVRQAHLVQNVPEDDFETYRRQVADLAERIQDTEYAIAAKSEAFRIETQPVTIEGIRQRLPARSALLQYAVYTPIDADDEGPSPHLAAYLLHADGRVQGMKLGPMSDFDGRLAAFRQTRSDTLAAWLHRRLLAPFLPDPGALSHLFISPDGPLNLIPFEALVDEQGSPLLETVTISYLSTGRDLLRLGQQEPVELHAPVVLAEPDYGPGEWDPLPGTRTEAELLRGLYPTATVLLGAEATVERLRAIDSPEILHVATHGFVDADDPRTLADDNPMTRSGLALAGANDAAREGTRLLASEAVTLDLDGTKLVVLSACESGLGQAANGEGVYGMRRALALAGSESQLVSLWPVSDAATAVFMGSFYGRVKDGEPLAQALQQAKAEMRGSEDWSDPAYWSPFVLAGEWR